MAVESSPVGRLVEEFLGLAFKSHPYGMSLIGPMSDIHNMNKKTALDFYNKYYVPSNMMVAMSEVKGVLPQADPHLSGEHHHA